jgi:hypothetical protein
MKTIQELYQENIEAISLSVLLFGPNPSVIPSDAHAKSLLDKRLQIRGALEGDGHLVKFGEDLVDPGLPPPASNPFLQELLLFSSFDVIIVLLYSYGTQIEVGAIATNPEAAQKSHLFLCDSFTDGLPFHACIHARDVWKAKFSLYKYPSDIVDCNLLQWSQETVAAVRVAKFLSL